MLPRLLVLTDRKASSRDLAGTIEGAINGGARAVVFREKDLPAGERERLALDVAPLVNEVHGFLVVASDCALAHRVAERFLDLTAGVHLASADALPDRPPALVGRSCHDEADLRAAQHEGVDYVTLSPVAPSSSKPGYGPLLGVDRFAKLVSAVRRPVYALGGVDASNAGDFLAAGAHGVAVMGAVMGAADPAAATAALVDAIRHAEPV